MNDHDSDPLDDLLAQWQPQIIPPPGFQRELWRRIAAETPQAPWIERFAWWLLRPKQTIAVITASVAVAVVWGLTHPPEPLNPHDAYVMSISPFDSNHLNLNRP